MIDEKVQIYLLTDLLNNNGTYCYNAVYAFKSQISARRCETFLRTSGGEHCTTITPMLVSSEAETVQVITETTHDGLCDTMLFTDYDEARDYVEYTRSVRPTATLHHDSLKLHSRFVPGVLHTGWAEL